MYTVIAAGTITRVGLGLLLVRTLLYLAQDIFQESMEKVSLRRCISLWLHIYHINMKCRHLYLTLQLVLYLL